MRQLSCIGLVLIALCAGCESQQKHRHHRATRLSAVRPPTAVVERTLISAGVTKDFSSPTLLRVRGDKEDFNVVTGPLGSGWQGAGDAAIGSFALATANSTGAWHVQQGYAYMWGWWPTSITPRVAAGADGSELLVIVDKPSLSQPAKEYIVFLEGTQARILSKINWNELATMSSIDTWVEVTGTDTAPQITPPAALSTAPQLVKNTVKEARAQRAILEGW